MTELQSQVREKRAILREIYGGSLTLNELSSELGLNRERAKEWGREHGLCLRVGKRIRYDTDVLARELVWCRQ